MNNEIHPLTQDHTQKTKREEKSAMRYKVRSTPLSETWRSRSPHKTPTHHPPPPSAQKLFGALGPDASSNSRPTKEEQRTTRTTDGSATSAPPQNAQPHPFPSNAASPPGACRPLAGGQNAHPDGPRSQNNSTAPHRTALQTGTPHQQHAQPN